MDWISYWEKGNELDVSARHTETHYKKLRESIQRFLPQGGPSTLLDWGCGEALYAFSLEGRRVKVLLYDPTERVRAELAERFEALSYVQVLGNIEAMSIPPNSIDVIVLNSVAQYLSEKQLKKLVSYFKDCLTPGGFLVVGDVIMKDTTVLADILSLLTAGLEKGFFWASIGNLFKNFFSEYRKVKKKNGFARYNIADIVSLLEGFGFKADVLPENLGLSKHRKSFLGQKI